MRRTAGRPPAEYEKAWRDGTLGQIPARGPGSRPRRKDEGGGDGRRLLSWRAPPAPAGAPPRTPALLRDARPGRCRRAAGPASPRRPRDGYRGTPAQVKGASGVAGDDAKASPSTRPGNPRSKPGAARRGDAGPLPGGARDNAVGSGRHQDSAAGQMFDKTRDGNWEITRPAVRPAGRIVGTGPQPRQQDLGRIESPPNSGCSRAVACPGS